MKRYNRLVISFALNVNRTILQMFDGNRSTIIIHFIVINVILNEMHIQLINFQSKTSSTTFGCPVDWG